MEQFDFEICGMRIRINADVPMEVDRDAELFLKPGLNPDLKVHLSAVPELLPPDGLSEKGNWLRPVYVQDGAVSRGCRALGRASLLSRLDYLLAERNHAQCVVLEQDCKNGYASRNLWASIMINYLLIPFRSLTFHASFIEHAGQGILFTAPSGTGKSTQAELWRKHRDAMVINGDKAGVQLTEKGVIAHGMPISGTSGICYNMSCPLKAIVVLSQAHENTVKRLSPSQAVSVLCHNVFVDKAVPEEWQMAVELLLDLVTLVPVYALACTPDERAVVALENEICKDKEKVV